MGGAATLIGTQSQRLARTGPPMAIAIAKVPDMCAPGTNFLRMAMHLCDVTKNISIGGSVNIVSMWRQLRLAED